LITDARLTFAQKQSMAKAMCWSQHTSPIWDFINALYTLRNDLAHSLGNDKTNNKLRRLLDAHEATLDSKQLEEVSELGPAGRLKDAIIHTMGFLGSYGNDAIAYRHAIDRKNVVRQKSSKQVLPDLD
jgi:hypothetical protein